MDILDTLKELIEAGEILAPQGGNIFDGFNGNLQSEYISWRLQAISAIQDLGDYTKPILKDIEADSNGTYFMEDSAKRLLGGLKAALAIGGKKIGNAPSLKSTTTNKNINNREIFIVHGHDELLLNQVARFLEKLKLKPIILFEQAGKGKTIIEKLEDNSDANFAIVLLTPDDLGKHAKSTGELQPRARQNVIFELGYFVGKFQREKVAVLYHESVELPSDYRGVEYIKIDKEGAWKLRIAKEIKVAGFQIDLNLAI